MAQVMFLLLFLIFPVLIGVLFVALVLPPAKMPKHFFPVTCFLSIGIGFGISYCLTFLLLTSVGLSRRSILSTELLLSIILAGRLFYRTLPRRQPFAVDKSLAQSTASSGAPRAISICFLIALLFSLMVFAASSWKAPHGGWDAFAIWNRRARFLFRAGIHWVDAFSEHLGKVDYPLFIPTNVARGWVIVGSDTTVIPIILSALFTFSIVGLTVSSLSFLRGRSQGSLAGLVLCGTPFLISLGASQLADVPLAFLFLSTLVLFRLKTESPAYQYRLVFLAGVAAGFSTGVKNEGSLFLVSTLLSLTAIALVPKKRLAHSKDLGYFFLGTLPGLAVTICFKSYSPISGLFFDADFHTLVSKITDPARHLLVLGTFQRELRNFGGWPFSMPIFLLFYVLVLGTRRDIRFGEEVAPLLMVLAMMLAGYYWVYILGLTQPGTTTAVHPTWDLLTWHLQTSLDRLLVQLWPSAVFAYFLTTRTIEEVVAKRQREASTQLSRAQ